MTARLDVEIAVVGAGPAGQAMALALADSGFSVALVDAGGAAAAASRSDLRVFALSLASMRLLASLGAWPPPQAERVQAYRHMHVWQDDFSAALHFDAGEQGWPQLGCIVEHGVLQYALARQLERYDRLQCHWQRRVVQLGHDADAVLLGLDNGEQVRARLAVAADGGASPLRQLAGLAVDRRPYGQSGLVANLRCERPHGDTAWQRFLPDGPLALLPLAGLDEGHGFAAGHACSIVWTLPEAEAERMRIVPPDEFGRELENASQGLLGRLSLQGARAVFPLARQLAARYHHGRVVLVADAAHVVHPLAGQGLNLGFLDVAALSQVLCEARRRGLDPAQPAVLARYARWRQGDNAMAARAFSAIGAMYRSRFPGLPSLRDAGHRLAGALPPLRRQLVMHAAGLAGRVPDRCRKAPASAG
ncbi:UbiH/UbiF/VisC/COQ6 family ubiquinone biosynthesis hydroxylase [Pseudofulvimonas gallinarii]|uniref:2-octaprenyl-6-methoxyphenol hydroxylase /2-octaprenyl-3-methyl-6-methoxy-1,4-benzoquinol hydroxylase n=1 Tax=Pseudofulvimonas gallinarii TaxID=634155 RepID=A0A4R3L2E3_9GAMM|nr:UbiH/UbiF/VisC/COQ6 family ubiquinone biosynthesis hydroxylase [Pseudofulvimonas gallinarii]TCS92861.1 2-octaprenyl-6-methoxyphenol hydroxylase /2-octaprenyl-3-methyl-6-methoxy-1,4-benzoquinol hydroxylase [Pseudofulvimonas gallinarii]THD12461.1 hypothetical protein B1808_12920 [Pseudofulvimonas gallinarii]